MGTENGLNGKNRGPKKQGAGALKSLSEIGNVLKKAAGIATEEQPSLEAPSIAGSDPRNADITERLRKRKIPEGIWDYLFGLKQIPQSESSRTPEEQKIHDLIHEFGPTIERARILGYQAHRKKSLEDESSPDYVEWHKKSLERAKKMTELVPELAERDIPEAFHAYARGEENIPDELLNDPKWKALSERLLKASYSLPQFPQATGNIASYEQRKTKDLPPMPRELQDRIREYPATVNYAIMMFTRQLREWKFTNERTQKFARYFAELIEEKAFRENPNARDRSRYENAYWALVHLGVIQEEYGKSKRPEITMRGMETAKQIERFIHLEHIRRLEKEREKPGTNTDAIDAELQKLRTAPTYFIERSNFYKGHVPEEAAQNPSIYEESATTIVETFGNRLYVNANSLPIDEAELTEALQDMEPEEVAQLTAMKSEVKQLQKRLARYGRTLSIGTADAERDVEFMATYLREGRTWDEGPQEGFEILMRQILTNIQHAESQLAMIKNVADGNKLSPEETKLISTHTKHVDGLYKSLRATEAKLISIWNEHHPEANAAPRNAEVRSMQVRIKELEEEQSIDREVFETIRDKMVQARKTKNFRAVVEIEALLNEYLSLSNKK